MKKGKRLCSTVLALSVFLSGFAGSLPQVSAQQTARVADVTSNVWPTPEIPPEADFVSGVEQTVVDLNETTGDGTWKFLFESPEGVPLPTEENQDFDFTQWTDKDWQPVIVPGELVMQGFDIGNNTEYYYQRTLTIPEDYAGKRVLLRFDGVYSDARVWVDSHYIRSHTGGFTTWDCDITGYALPGQTITLTVGVADLEDNQQGTYNPDGSQMLGDPSWASFYAHHNVGGILRDVSLLALPKDYIARVYTGTDFDENFINADLEVTAQLGMVSSNATLQIELIDKEGQTVAEESMDFSGRENGADELSALLEEAGRLLEENKENTFPEGEEGGNGQYPQQAYDALKEAYDQAAQALGQLQSQLSDAKKVVIPIKKPDQWDAEHPNLYTLKTSLLVDGKLQQVNTEKIGFREIHYGGRDGSDVNKVYVNGKEVKLRGTCRHDVSYDLGRSISKEKAWEEIRAYKEANINFIRTSHYPASEEILDACDELGIYVEQENAACFQGANDNAIQCPPEDFVNEFTEMIERDRNRASILIWSLGNESGFEATTAFRTEFNYVKSVDTSRPVIFSYPYTVSTSPQPYDIYSQHYAGVTSSLGSADIPVLHDEFAHVSCYNVSDLQRDINVRNFWGESIKMGWENIFTTDGALGCALWGGIDDVFYIPEGTTERWQTHSDGAVAGYGEWGSVLDAYLRQKPEAYLTKKAFSPVRVQEEDAVITPEGLSIPVKNWFDHTDLSEVKLVYRVDGGQEQTTAMPAIAPHGQGNIFLPGEWDSAQKVNLQFYTADGIMVDEYNLDLTNAKICFEPASETPPALEESENELVVRGGDFSVTFDKETSQIKEAVHQDTVLITGGPYLHVTGMALGDW